MIDVLRTTRGDGAVHIITTTSVTGHHYFTTIYWEAVHPNESDRTSMDGEFRAAPSSMYDDLQEAHKHAVERFDELLAAERW